MPKESSPKETQEGPQTLETGGFAKNEKNTVTEARQKQQTKETRELLILAEASVKYLRDTNPIRWVQTREQ
jgi:hypothetical protein